MSDSCGNKTHKGSFFFFCHDCFVTLNHLIVGLTFKRIQFVKCLDLCFQNDIDTYRSPVTNYIILHDLSQKRKCDEFEQNYRTGVGYTANKNSRECKCGKFNSLREKQKAKVQFIITSLLEDTYQSITTSKRSQQDRK